MSKAIIWCRVSTDAQEIESQKKELTALAIKDGFREEDLIIIGEKGASAIKLNDKYQEEVNKLLETIDTNKAVSTIYVWEISRLARNEVAFVAMKQKILDKHIQFICKTPELKLFDANGELNQGAEITLSLLITLARQEMQIKKKRFSRGKKEKAELGLYTGGVVPFGYCIGEGKKIVIDERESAIVLEIFEKYEQGMSQTQIAKDFCARGVKGRKVRFHGVEKENDITISLVHQILTNELLTGKESEEKVITMKINRQTNEVRQWTAYPRKYPQIISPTRFERCREIARKNNTQIDKTKFVYYASRLIKCPVCGRFFVATGGRTIYHCFDATNKNKEYNGYAGQPCCSNKSCISINVVDSLLWHLAQKLDIEYRFTSAQEEKEQYQNQINELNIKIGNIDNRLLEIRQSQNRLSLAFAKGRLDEDLYEDQYSDLEKQEADIKSEGLDYQEQVIHLQSLIDGISSEYGTDGISLLTNELDNISSLVKKMEGITNDKVRFDIIHKHIKVIHLGDANISYKYGCHPTPIEKNGKVLTIYTYRGDIYKYGFVSNAGNGKGYVRYNEDGTYYPVDIPYLARFEDKHKKKNREKNRVIRIAEKANKLAERQQRVLTITEASERLSMSAKKITYDIKQGYLKATQAKDRLYYIPLKELDHYKDWLDKRGMYRGKRKGSSQ